MGVTDISKKTYGTDKDQNLHQTRLNKLTVRIMTTVTERATLEPTHGSLVQREPTGSMTMASQEYLET